MQVFIPYADPFRTAAILDYRRLNKQVIECRQILKSIAGESKAWANHPVTRMYRNHTEWLRHYMLCLESFQTGFISEANWHAEQANACRPVWMTTEFCNQHKRRLYTKDPDFYMIWWKYGKSEENWYVIDGQIIKYINGKLIK